MSELIESYSRIIFWVQQISDQIKAAEQEIAKRSSTVSDNSAVRIKKLEEQLEKIDDYLLKVRGFQELAKKNLDSQNVLTIEAPPGYRVNLNRLRNWAMMIDPTSSNDPYAQRVNVVAKCDEHFLLGKQKEFRERIEQLKSQQESGDDEEQAALKRQIAELQETLRQYVRGEEMAQFAKKVVEANEEYWHKNAASAFSCPAESVPMLAAGANAVPLPVDKTGREWLKTMMGGYYDAENSRVLLPLEMDNRREYILRVLCTPSRRKDLDRALQHLVLETVKRSPAGSRKVQILDAVRYSAASMGSLRSLEGTFALEPIPRNPEQLTNTLERIVSSMADLDEQLEAYDSVAEFNEGEPSEKRIAQTTLVVFGWPNAFTGRDRELLQRIMTGYERFGVSIVTVSYQNADKKDYEVRDPMPEYALQNAVTVTMQQKLTTVRQQDNRPNAFVWYSLLGDISEECIKSVQAVRIDKKTVSNEYFHYYSDTDRPEYVRVYKKVELPFGVDSKGTIYNVSFENENFAAYLVGASRSGKSTLLHTLIAGLIRNYHPDNLELWLADFKQLEFKKYIQHRPAHVKYILLDESQELVYDLIDKLTQKMMERQRLFAQLGKERIDQIDATKLDEPLPVIFVILDEFSIMSQAIAESETYRLRLQNLLAKGAALGIRFLFSSQTFTTGIAGLTPTARAQIQQRIAMKGTKDEINATLELSSNIRTEQVNNWMDALPPHYALIKHRISADQLPEVNRVLVMYIPDYAVRDQMIDAINSKLKAEENYQPQQIRTYVNKHPVVVDGNSYESFDSRVDSLDNWLEIAPNREDYSGDEYFLNLGTPRLMDSMRPLALTPESRENLLLIGGAGEMPCTAAILLSAIRSFRRGGGKVHIWAYGRNRLYRKYQNVWNQFDCRTDLDEICDEIRRVHNNITSQEEGKDLFLLLGLERITAEFELAEGMPAGTGKVVHSDVNLDALIASGAVSQEEDGEPDLFAQLMGLGDLPDEPQEEMPASEPAQDPAEDAGSKETGLYNAAEDLSYLLRQGSRMGYYFMTASNSLIDFKQTGLKLDLFHHKLTFQISKDDSWELLGKSSAAGLPAHICQYSNGLDTYSFRPYVHKEIGWDGWSVDENGIAVNN